MEAYLELALNVAGFAVGLCIGVMSAIGYRNTASPTLLRLSMAFISISIGFLVVWVGYALELLPSGPGGPGWWLETLGVGVQTLGYFFIAFSHGLKSFFPKSRYLRGVGVFPLFLVSTVQLNYLLRSVSFILLVYAAIETILSYVESRNRGTVSVRRRPGDAGTGRVSGVVLGGVSRVASVSGLAGDQDRRAGGALPAGEPHTLPAHPL